MSISKSTAHIFYLFVYIIPPAYVTCLINYTVGYESCLINLSLVVPGSVEIGYLIDVNQFYYVFIN